MILRWYHPIRYEYKPWPLWRLDLNLAYILKSFNHQRSPLTMADNDHFLAMNQWLNERSWQSDSSEPSIALGAVGDLRWIRSGWHNALSPGAKQLLSHADLTVANLETPIDPSRKVPKWTYDAFRYNAPAEYLSSWQDLPAHAQHVFSICNDHALDQGVKGLSATRNSILNQGDTFHCLGGMNDGEEMTLLDIKGLKIGFLASTFTINKQTSRHRTPQGIPIHLFGCSHVQPDWTSIATQIKQLKNKGAEFIVFSPHWSFKHEYWPDALQRKHALKLIELGVDLILGHSPHVIQPVEMVSINNMDSTCPLQIERSGAKGFGIIAWSLGNFLTVMPTLACKTGVVMQLDLIKKDQHILIKDLQLKPVFTSRPAGGAWLDRQVMCLNELTDSDASLRTQIVRHYQQMSPLVEA